MRRLFLSLYGLIIVSLLVAMLATESFKSYFYDREVAGDHLKRAVMLTQAIQRDIAQGGNEAASLAWWRGQLHENDEIDLTVTALPPGVTRPYVKKVSISEAEDQLELLVPFDAARALNFSVHDRAEPGAVAAYYSGFALVFLVLAGLLYALIQVLYRHVEAIRQHARNVAEGDYGNTLPMPRAAAFLDLHQDLNRMAGALEEKTRDNHMLTAAIHHELRTPLTRLRLALDMALTTPRSHEIPGLLREMDGALNELTQLMEDLLLLSRLRLGPEAPPRAQLALDQLLAECVARCADPRIALHAEPCHLQANRPLLERALSNLLDNARKHARQHIAVALAVQGGDIVLEIGDDGPGIPAELRERVRQPFFRVERDRGRRSGGVGLGLAIADLALRESGAQWTIGDSAWGGAAFRLVWRATPAEPARKPEQASS